MEDNRKALLDRLTTEIAEKSMEQRRTDDIERKLEVITVSTDLAVQIITELARDVKKLKKKNKKLKKRIQILENNNGLLEIGPIFKKEV
jgi:signal recognition particle GTPase